MLRWNRTLVRATAGAAVAGLVITSIGGVIGLPGPALLAALVAGVAIAVAVALTGKREEEQD